MNPSFSLVDWVMTPQWDSKGQASWSLFFTCLLLPIVVPSCSTQPEPFPSVASDCADCGGVHATSASDRPALPSVPLHEKLGTHLLALSKIYADGGSSAVRAYAQSNSLDVPEERVSVQVLAASEQDVQRLERRIGEVGGSVLSVFESSIFAMLPVSAIGALASTKGVWRMDMQRNVLAPPDLINLNAQGSAPDAK